MTPVYRQTAWLLIAVLGSIAAIALSWGLATLSSQDQPYIMVGIPVVTILGGIAIIAWSTQHHRLIAVISLSLLVFAIDATFRAKEYEDISLDWQSLLKLALLSMAFMLGLWGLRQTHKHFQMLPLGMLIGYGSMGLLSALYSPAPTYTFSAAFAFVGVVLFVPWVLERLSPRGFIKVLIFTLLLLQLSSWLWYITSPEQAIRTSWTPEGSVSRLSGIIGQPNNLGRIAALTIGLCVTALWAKWETRYKIFIPLIAFSLGTWAGTQSRISIGALAGALALLYILTYRARKTLLFLIIGLLALTLWIVSDQRLLQSLAMFVARTGESQELTTFTGRTFIWRLTWSLVAESPWIGYGYAIARVLIPQNWDFDFTVQGTSHNMLLESLLYVGITGTAFLIISIVSGLVYMLRAVQREKDKNREYLPFAFMLLFNALYGLLERGMVGVPNLSTITFVAGIAFFAINRRDRENFPSW